MAYDWKTETPGVFSRHADGCEMRDTGECTCGPLGYRASIRDRETNRRTLSRMYETSAEALSWQRDEAMSQDGSWGGSVDRGALGSLIDEFLQSVEHGLAGPQNPRENARALRGALSYVDSELGSMPVQDVRRRHIQAMLDQLHSTGVAPARMHSVVDALQALYSYGIQRELVDFSPVVELQLPETNGNGPGSTGLNGPPPPGAPYQSMHFQGQPSQAASPQASPPQDPPYQAPPPQSPPPQDPPYQGPPPQDPPPQDRPTQEPPTQGGTPGEPGTATPPFGDPWTPPPYAPPPFTQPPFAGVPPPAGPYVPPGTNNGFTAPYPGAPPYPATPPPWATGYGQPTAPPQPTGPLGNMFGMAPTMAPDPASQANYDATMQERWLWWTVRIIVIVFVLIALVLVAESV